MGAAASLAGVLLVATPESLQGLLYRTCVGMCLIVFVYWLYVIWGRTWFTEGRENHLMKLGTAGAALALTADFVSPPSGVGENGFGYLGLVWLVSWISLLLANRNHEARSTMVHLSDELESKNKELSELDELKDDFLAKTSHELRAYSQRYHRIK